MATYYRKEPDMATTPRTLVALTADQHTLLSDLCSHETEMLGSLVAHEDADGLDELVQGLRDALQATAPARDLLVLLRVQVPGDDLRMDIEIKQALLGAIEVGSDDESMAGLDVELV